MFLNVAFCGNEILSFFSAKIVKSVKTFIFQNALIFSKEIPSTKEALFPPFGFPTTKPFAPNEPNGVGGKLGANKSVYF